MTTSCLFKRVRPAGFIALFTACALVGPPATEARAGAYGVTVAALTPKQRLAAATYKKAKMRFVAGDYDGALTLFRQAEQLHPGAAPKHKIAECLDKLGRTEEAIAAYQLFIDSNPTGKYQQRVARARQRIEQLKATLGAKATLTVTPVGIAFAVSVDGVPSRGPEVALSAGQHTIEVSAPGYQPARQQVNAAKGQHLNLQFALLPVASVQPPMPFESNDDDGSGQPLIIAGLVVAGVGAAAFVPMGVFGVQALDAKHRFDKQPGQNTAAVADEAENNALLSDVFLGIGGGLVLTGAALIVFGASSDSDGGDSAALPLITPVVGANGAGVSASWAF